MREACPAFDIEDECAQAFDAQAVENVSVQREGEARELVLARLAELFFQTVIGEALRRGRSAIQDKIVARPIHRVVENEDGILVAAAALIEPSADAKKWRIEVAGCLPHFNALLLEEPKFILQP